MTTATAVATAQAEPACIYVERAPVGARTLHVPCTRKANHECCGFRFCAEHYKWHRRGSHPPADKALARRRRAA